MGMMPPGGGYGAGLAAAASPPQMPPMQPPGPPPPSGIGALPTGSADSMSTPRTSVSAAIMALREVKNQVPSMASAIDGFVAQLQAAMQSKGQSPEGAAGKPPAVPASSGSDIADLPGGDEADADG